MLTEFRNFGRITDMLKTVYPAKTLFCGGGGGGGGGGIKNSVCLD